MRFKIVIILVMSLISVYGGTAKLESNSPAELVDQYKEGVKNSLANLLENSLDQNSAIIVKNNIVNKTSNYNTKEFIELVKKRVIANGDTQVSYLYQDNDNASIRLNDTSGKIKYSSFISCLKTGDDWKIVNIIITINKI